LVFIEKTAVEQQRNNATNLSGQSSCHGAVDDPVHRRRGTRVSVEPADRIVPVRLFFVAAVEFKVANPDLVIKPTTSEKPLKRLPSEWCTPTPR
jgi:hypothetical protein